ncbi:MAG: YraN family protein [Bdellovibrionales bacterium]|nr:YraN family protein [Bdellovibrionales bacterium]
MALYFENRGFKVFSQNKKWFGVEVDLIVIYQDQYWLVEVKSLSYEWQLPYRVHKNQKNRLKKVLACFQDYFDKAALVYFAFVEPSGRVLFLKLEDLE